MEFLRDIQTKAISFCSFEVLFLLVKSAKLIFFKQLKVKRHGSIIKMKHSGYTDINKYSKKKKTTLDKGLFQWLGKWTGTLLSRSSRMDVLFERN